MHAGREEKSHANFSNGLAHNFRRKIEGNAESFENVSGAAAGTEGAIAVFGDFDAGASNDESGSGGNVEGPARVATGAASVDEHFIGGPFGVENRFSVVAHGFGEADQLVDGFAFFAQGGEEIDDLWVSGFAGEELIH